MRKRALFPLILPLLYVLSTGTVEAEIYKWVDASGQVHFTDKPVQGVEPHTLNSISTLSNQEYNLEKNSMQMRFTDVHGSMIVRGSINGVSMRFVVDTGATLCTVPPDIARQAHISTAGAKIINLQTANGRTTAPLVNISNIEADGVSQRNIKLPYKKYRQIQISDY